MILNGVMAIILRYFTEFGKPVFKYITASACKKELFTFAISSVDEFLVCDCSVLWSSRQFLP